ncbi:hypothetical protein Taro_030479 [Colocasia esculenta]|uniref:Receptor-like serine/threonine-protein kinase n=1 Tax=Colocasia esculenta TaxID=4460 RepID=A0A843VY19_COLES|nr:hypothetical protein [Colocasia esculenta]
MGFASSGYGGGRWGILGCSVSSLLLIVIILGSSFPIVAHAAEILYKRQSLSLNESLESAGGRFRLGFFSRGSSPKRYYLGIWYNTSGEAVVWVANRATPLNDTAGGRLTILDNGTLAVVDGAGAPYWSSNSTIDWSNSSATLEDDGAFVLRAGDGVSQLWSSFDHPTDTFIPKMEMTADPAKRQAPRFVSWRSLDDPAPGNYSLGLDPNGSGQLYIWNGEKFRWRSGQWNRESFIGITRMRPLSIYGFNLAVGDNGTMSLTFTPPDDTLLRFVMAWDGVERTSTLNQSSQEWGVVWEQPLTDCETYNFCGRNGICSNESSCSCLRGFQPRSELEWNAGDRSSGCVRRTLLGCQSNSTNSTNSSSPSGVAGDAFARFDNVKLPDFAETILRIDEDTCAALCSGNCSCIGYAYVTSIGCMVWTGDLVDLAEFVNSTNGKTLFLKLAGSEFTESEWWRNGEEAGDYTPDQGVSTGVRQDFSGPRDQLLDDEQNGAKASDLPMFSFDAIAAATDNFSDSNKLGQGGFGHVYRGVLPAGEEIAVKRLSRSSGQGVDEFKNEVTLIAKLQHRNLVRLLGCCIQGEEKILIYEYMPNKSLDSFLFNPTRQPMLDWRKRFDIIEGVARGLLYLHRDSRLRVVHRDLKASNILLDEEMNPKISDFGMARIFGGNQNSDSTNRVVWQLWTADREEEIIDPCIRDSCPAQQVLRCIHIGLLCVQDRAHDRPTMSTVVIMLGSEAPIHQVPKQPTFAAEGSPSETGSQSQSQKDDGDGFSVNDVTITTLTGR